jgi:UDP-glucuronate 4-epimerase
VTSPILVTGVAGFIGAAVAAALLERGERVVGLDNLNPYYDPALKRARLDLLRAGVGASAFQFEPLDLTEGEAIAGLCSSEGVDRVIHLAAQAGVRHSISHPGPYVQSNLVGFAHVLEACRQQGVRHLVYASSSSVYGGNRRLPFSERHPVNHPVSLYAATKRANELMAHSYSHLYGLPATGLRFFTVYGPWGRPDMAPMLFARAILAGEPIRVFNHGAMERDFTYIADIVAGVIRCLDKPATVDADFDPLNPDPATAAAPHRLFNIGNSQPVPLLRFIEVLESELGQAAIRDLQPLQPGDVLSTAADTSALEAWIGFRPTTTIEEGVARFAAWYREHHGT